MSKFVFAWELGFGLGHVLRLKPIAERLVQRGHEVTAIIKDLRLAGVALRTAPVPLFQAPVAYRGFGRLPKILTFAHMLHNVGFVDEPGLRSRAGAWRELLKLIKPDVLLADHSPSALFAARGLPLRKATIGTGFSCPGLSTPMATLRRDPRISSEALLAHEMRLTATMNRVLEGWPAPTLGCVCDLYRDVDAELLATYEELDPYGNRESAQYRGIWSAEGGSIEPWPPGTGPKVFAYLKPSPGIAGLFEALSRRGWPTLVVGEGFLNLAQLFQGSSVRFSRRPLNMRHACETCDFAILNATHGSTAAVLLAGKPVVLIPLVLENTLTAERVDAIGAGRVASVNERSTIDSALDEVQGVPSYRSAAQAFAARHSGRNPEREIDEIIDELEHLATNGG